MDENNLKYNQEVLYKLFTNSISNNRLANCYLLYGDLNSPLKSTALYLAKSLSCKTSVFACNSCPSCKRFDLGRAPDSFFIDGSIDTIKKSSIKELEEHFEYSSFEKDHIPTYVINMVDNITEEAANSLLKFLEEPKQEIIAFLTTHNIDSILKTILSRTIKVKVNPIDCNSHFSEICNLNYLSSDSNKKNKLSVFLSYILSKITSDIDEVNYILNDDQYVYSIEIIEDFFSLLNSNKREAEFLLLSFVGKIKDNKCYNYLFLTLSTLLSDVLSDNINDNCGISDLLINTPLSRKQLIKIKAILEDNFGLRRYNFNPTGSISRIINIIEGKDE